MQRLRWNISDAIRTSPSTLTRAETLALVAYECGIPIRTDWTAHELCALLGLRWEYEKAHPPQPRRGLLLAWLATSTRRGNG